MIREAFRGHFKMLLAQREDNLMSTNTPNEKGTPQSRTYTVNDIAAILGIGIIQNDPHRQHDPHLQKVF